MQTQNQFSPVLVRPACALQVDCQRIGAGFFSNQMNSKPEVYCSYLFADGHAVVVYQKRDPDAGEIKFAEVFERLGPDCHFKGRIVLHNPRGLLNLIRKSNNVRAVEPHIKHGSDRSKEMGVEVGYLEVCLSKDWQDSVCFYTMPGVLSASFTIQPGNEETFDPDASSWSGYRIARIHRVKQPQQSNSQAA